MLNYPQKYKNNLTHLLTFSAQIKLLYQFMFRSCIKYQGEFFTQSSLVKKFLFEAFFEVIAITFSL